MPIIKCAMSHPNKTKMVYISKMFNLFRENRGYNEIYQQ